jgi:SPP1 gp7 family putative phage head morphogenesis protein
MINYELKKMINGQPGTSVNVPVIPESLAFRRAYLAELRRVLVEISKVTKNTIIPEYSRSLTMDASESAFDALRRMVKGLLLGTNATIRKLLDLEAIKHTDRFKNAARQSFKIDLQGVVAAEDLSTYIDRAALRNAGLVTGMTDDLIRKIQTITTNSLINGETVNTLRGKLKAEFDISDSRARLIARDQTSKLSADLNKIRHLQAGVTAYIWRTSHDERVRPRHAKLNNVRYDYGQPTGAEEGLEPGQPIQCRCIAQGVVEFGDKPFKSRSKSIGKPAPVSPLVTKPKRRKN